MFARVSLVALVLASPAWADADYPAGLFEHSPVTDGPAAAPHPGSRSVGKAPSKDGARGGCHHYREWRYPYPQPC